MRSKILREAVVIVVETAILLALVAAFGPSGRRPPKAEAAVSFEESLLGAPEQRKESRTSAWPRGAH